MSSTLYCVPRMPIEGYPLPDELKYKLGRKLCDTDGSIGYATDVDASLIPYLEGLKDAGIKGAEQLIGLIKKHREVTLTWQH